MPEFFNPDGEISKTSHNLPHWQQGDVWIFATWRLADSVPSEKIKIWKDHHEAWLRHHPKPWDDATAKEHQHRFVEPFETWLDQGVGECQLRDPENRKIVEDAFNFFNGQRYDLGAFVIMPNHVHILFRPIAGHEISAIIHSWKRHTAKLINKRESRTGKPFWQSDYFDRLIRSQEHFQFVADYIRKNPKEPKRKRVHALRSREKSKERGFSTRREGA